MFLVVKAEHCNALNKANSDSKVVFRYFLIYSIQYKYSISTEVQKNILSQLLQRSKKSYCHYSKINHTTSQWGMRKKCEEIPAVFVQE